MQYGIMDASDLVMVNKATGNVELYVDYANATTSEWTSEPVYATAKGANVIRWDSSREGTLQISTEVFDFGYLAMVMGSENKKNQTTNFMVRKEGVVNDSKQIIITDNPANVDVDTISVIPLERAGGTSHAGNPVRNNSIIKNLLPRQVGDLQVTPSDKSVKLVFPNTEGASSYQVFRGTELLAEVNNTMYVDENVTPTTEYDYQVRAVNEYGYGPKSAIVKVTTTAEGAGAGEPVMATSQAITAAQRYEAEEVNTLGELTYTYEDGVITFNEYAITGQPYAIYYFERRDGVRELKVSADQFSGSYEIYANSLFRRQHDGQDLFVQTYYPNARPQPNFTLTQSATEPTSLDITFDLFPESGTLAQFNIIE